MADEVDQFPTREEIANAIEGEPAEDPILKQFDTDQEREIAGRLLPGLTAKIAQQAEARKAKQLADEVARLTAANEKMMRDEIDKLRAANAPPDEKQLEKLLSQEYATMTVKVPTQSGEQTFTIGELPQAAEKKIVAIFQKNFVPYLKSVASVEWTASTTTAEKISGVVDMIPSGLDALAEIASIAIDPQGAKGISKDWVQANLSSARITNIVEAQFLVGKIRDFISAASRLLPK